MRFDFRQVPWTLSCHCRLQKVSEDYISSCLLGRGVSVRIWRRPKSLNWIRMRNQHHPLQDTFLRESFHGKFLLFINSGRTYFFRSWNLPRRISFVREHFHIAFHLFVNISTSHFICSWTFSQRILFVHEYFHIAFHLFVNIFTSHFICSWTFSQRILFVCEYFHIAFHLFMNIFTSHFIFSWTFSHRFSFVRKFGHRSFYFFIFWIHYYTPFSSSLQPRQISFCSDWNGNIASFNLFVNPDMTRFLFVNSDTVN
jgi:hypothetical protein